MNYQNVAITGNTVPDEVIEAAINEANERLPEWKYLQMDFDGRFFAATDIASRQGTFLHYPQGAGIGLMTTWKLTEQFMLVNQEPLEPEKIGMSKEDVLLFSKMSPDARQMILRAVNGDTNSPREK
jgi:hypothetical protein